MVSRPCRGLAYPPRHSRENGYLLLPGASDNTIPAFAGMTGFGVVLKLARQAAFATDGEAGGAGQKCDQRGGSGRRVG